MRKSVSVLVVLLAILATAFAATAIAKTTEAKVSSYTHNASKKSGVLTVSTKTGKYHFVVLDSANCGYSTGQSGNQIPCKKLGSSKYAGQPVSVTWTKVGGTKRASLVAVHLG